jgi:hypothetical protein
VKGAQTRSCGSPVLVQQTAEQVVSMHPALLLIADDRQSGGRVWRFKFQRSYELATGPHRDSPV